MALWAIFVAGCGTDAESEPSTDEPPRPLGTDFPPTTAGFCDELFSIVGQPSPDDLDEVATDADAIASAIAERFDARGPGTRAEFAVATQLAGDAAAALAAAARAGHEAEVRAAGQALLDRVDQVERVAVEQDLAARCSPESSGKGVAERAIEITAD